MSDKNKSPQPDGIAQPAADLPFQSLGAYQIIERIGHGGMGDVYRGWDPDLSRVVAIKVLPDELASDDEFIRRFYAEATAAARLVHPNVTAIYYIGEDAGQHFFAMQYVDGESLADRLERRTRLDVNSTLAIIEQVLSGLSAAHALGLVHRDIKPGNILLDRQENRAVLADFGLVKSLQGTQGMTVTGLVMGTVDYMAPEQGRGQELDGRADLYAVGVLMYQMLSGRLPFEADTPTAMIFQHVYEAHAPLRQVAPHVPAELAAIVERLLAKRPEDRYPNAGAVLAQLHAYRSGRSVSPGAEPWASPDKSPLEPMSADILLDADEFDEGAVFTWFDALRDRVYAFVGGRAPEFVARLQSTQQQLDSAIAEHEHRHAELQDLVEAAGGASHHPGSTALAENEQLATLRVQLARAAAQLEQLRTRRNLLNARLKVAQARIRMGGGKLPRSRVRTATIALALIAVCLLVGTVAVSSMRDRGTDPAKPATFAISSDARLIHILSDGREPVVSTAFSSDGTLIGSVTSKGTVHFHDVRSGEELQSLRMEATDAEKVVMDVDRKQVFALSQTKQGRGILQLWSAEGETRQLAAIEGEFRAIAMTPDRAYVAALSAGPAVSRVEIRKAAGGELVHARDIPDADTRVMAVSATGELVAVAGPAGPIQVWDTRSDVLGQQWQPEDVTITALAFHPDGSEVALGSSQGVVRFWNRGSTTITAELTAEGPVESLAFDSAGRRLAVVTADAIELWDLGLGCRRHVFQVPNAQTASFGPGNGAMISGGAEPALLCWDGSLQPLFIDSAVIARLSATTDELFIKIMNDHTRTADRRPVVTSAAMSFDGRLAVLGDLHGAVSLWDLQTGERLPQGLTGSSNHQGDWVADMAFSPDGRRVLISGGGGRPGVVWDTRTGEIVYHFEHQLRVVAYSPDGKYAAICIGDHTNRKDVVIRLWDTASEQIVRYLEGHTDSITDLAFSPDGEHLISGQSDSVHVWEVETGKRVKRIHSPFGIAWHVAYSVDGRHILSSNSVEACAWDLRTGDEVLRFKRELTGRVFGADRIPKSPLSIPDLIPEGLKHMRFNPQHLSRGASSPIASP